jgi:hypothetical protein
VILSTNWDDYLPVTDWSRSTANEALLAEALEHFTMLRTIRTDRVIWLGRQSWCNEHEEKVSPTGLRCGRGAIRTQFLAHVLGEGLGLSSFENTAAREVYVYEIFFAALDLTRHDLDICFDFTVRTACHDGRNLTAPKAPCGLDSSA